jgi:hypothetical protein
MIDTQSEFRAELQRVLDSDAFQHSDGLRRLLAYLGKKSLDGAAKELKEYTIGLEAFGKSSDYDPQQDPAVRVLASKLRHKLEDYYLKEGADHPVRIELPKGHYELKFELRQDKTLGLQHVLKVEVRKWRRISLGLAICTLLLFVLLAARWRGALSQGGQVAASAQEAWTPELELIWQPYLESNRSVLISLGTPLFTKFSGGFFRNPKINDWQEAENSAQLRLLQKTLESPHAAPWHNFTGTGEATGAFLLGKLLEARKPDLVLKRSSVLSWDDIQQNNVIFLGSPKFNLHLKDLPAGEGFVIEGGSIQNLRPRPGEREIYADVWNPTHSVLLEDYALIYRLPGLHGRGEIMVLASSSTDGTWAAVEYVTQAEYAKDLVSRLRLPSGDLPESFQVVVKARFKEQVPVEISHVTHRVLEGPWKSNHQ